MRLAIIGSGISGLGAAQRLYDHHNVHVFEQAPRAGGHAHTVSVTHTGQAIPVDVGFIVYNTRNYPRLTQLFNDLNVATENSDMSFSVHDSAGTLEWGGSPQAVFAQKRNIIRPRFLKMLSDILRFNKQANQDLKNQQLPSGLSLGDYVQKGRYGSGFQEDYLFPMGAAIWSCPMEKMANFPAYNFLSFFHNHGLISLNNRPQWRTVSGGSQNYVSRITEKLGRNLHLRVSDLKVQRLGQKVHLKNHHEDFGLFDHIIIATHGDEVLPLLTDASPQEIDAFSLFKTEANTGYLHKSPTVMPRRTKAWASWNYRKETGRVDTPPTVSVTYWMNTLQNLDPSRPIFVTLNPQNPPPEEDIFDVFEYRHPLYDQNTPTAHDLVQSLQGQQNTWYAGAYLGHGFHEDGLRTGQIAADAILNQASHPMTSPHSTAAE